jgi:hypothetical protein
LANRSGLTTTQPFKFCNRHIRQLKNMAQKETKVNHLISEHLK